MKRSRKFFCAILSAIVIVTALTANGRIAAAEGEEDPIMLFVGGSMLESPTPPHFAGPALIVPFNDIAMYVGATWDYDDAQKKTTVTIGNRYSILIEGSDYLIYGKLTSDGSAYATIQTKKLEAAPFRPEAYPDSLMVSHDAIGYGLGAELIWTPDTRTIFVTPPIIETPAPTPTPTEAAAPVPETPAAPTQPVATPTPAVPPAFVTTKYFQEVSGRRAQDMHDFKNKFVLVYYNSMNPESGNDVAKIKEAGQAADVTFQIVGVDESSVRYENIAQLKWIWEHTPNDANGVTKLFLHHADGKVELYTPLPAAGDITEMFKRLQQPVNTAPSPTPTPIPTGTPTPTASPALSVNEYGIPNTWERIDISTSQLKYDNNEKFIFVYLDTSLSDYDRKYVEYIAQAATEANKKVFYCNQNYTYSWWGSDVYGGGGMYVPNVTVFVVWGKTNVYFDPHPTNVANMRSYFISV
ncbi:MAG: copper amine oxidase N-terminal domain-containing protein [Clostridiales bacterium]|nr:copper amine oxidase N-terminal domain-containing protein [Clostridiales bacterium]